MKLKIENDYHTNLKEIKLKKVWIIEGHFREQQLEKDL